MRPWSPQQATGRVPCLSTPQAARRAEPAPRLPAARVLSLEHGGAQTWGSGWKGLKESLQAAEEGAGSTAVSWVARTGGPVVPAPESRAVPDCPPRQTE